MQFSSLFPDAYIDRSTEAIAFRKTNVRICDVAFSEITPLAVGALRWIDGGSATIISTPARCVAIIRVVAVQTNALERTHIDGWTYLVSITSTAATFIVRCQPVGVDHKEIASVLTREIEKATLPEDTTPESLVDPLRVLAERSVGNGVIDGSSRLLHPLLAEVAKRPAIAKTSELLTNNGRPLASALQERAPSGVWYARVGPLVLVRLHPHASHIFIVESANDELLSALMAWSADVTFYGYPYPLILADQLARITNQERDMWRATLACDPVYGMMLAKELRSTDAHDVLEHILYGKQMF